MFVLGPIFGQPQSTKTEDSTKPQSFTIRSVPRPDLYADGPYISQPVFQTVQDSVDYYSLETILADQSLIPEKRDSLRNLYLRIGFENVASYRKIYRGSPGYKPLTSIPDSELATTKKISIYKVRRLPNKVLRCVAAEELEFVQTSIKKLPRKLNRLSLKTIRIYDNNGRSSFMLVKNKSVEILLVRGTNPRNVPVRFERLENLRSLDLSMTGLEEIPKSIFNVKSLKLVKLGGNKITLNNYQFPTNTTLQALDLSGNQIATIPSSIGNLSGLISLSMNNSKVEKIEDGIGELKKLTQLAFYKNNIKALPHGIYNLSELKEIDLYHNEIERLDEEISNWKSLEILYLSHNKLIALPENIKLLTNLRELYAHDNRISYIPDELNKFEKLKVLRVNNNYLMALPTSIGSLASAQNIDLSNNKLREIPEGLWSLTNLELLSLGANPWDQSAWETIQQKAEELRKRQIIVNLKTPEEIEN
jgi:Leucine-rich repeat (LRR) protein